MHTNTRTLLMAAIAAVLMAPAAHAQSIHANGHAAAQVEVPKTPPALPPTASGTAQDAMDHEAMDQDDMDQDDTDQDAMDQDDTDQDDTDQDAMVQDATTKPVGHDSDRTDTPMTPPMAAQGAAHAQAHSSVAQRDTWATLDSDHDGRISTTEAEADSAFGATFGDVDADHDGFVSDSEYRTYAKADMDTAQGAEHAAGHSAVVTRDVFGRLDTDADGRISTTEAALDADFNGMLTTMDADGDGFVSQAEYRAHAKADMP